MIYKLSDFDIDLTKGQAGEASVAKLLTIETVEVKTDLKWWRTGNIYIETECWFNASNSWKASGLMTTKATHWALNLEGTVILIETKLLYGAVKMYGTPIECKIEPNPSKGYLIRPSKIMQFVKDYHEYSKQA